MDEFYPVEKFEADLRHILPASLSPMIEDVTRVYRFCVEFLSNDLLQDGIRVNNIEGIRTTMQCDGSPYEWHVSHSRGDNSIVFALRDIQTVHCTRFGDHGLIWHDKENIESIQAIARYMVRPNQPMPEDD